MGKLKLAAEVKAPHTPASAKPSSKIQQAQKVLIDAVNAPVPSPGLQHAQSVVAAGKHADTLGQLMSAGGEDEGSVAPRKSIGGGSGGNACPVCAKTVYFMEQVEVEGSKYHKAYVSECVWIACPTMNVFQLQVLPLRTVQ